MHRRIKSVTKYFSYSNRPTLSISKPPPAAVALPVWRVKRLIGNVKPWAQHETPRLFLLAALSVVFPHWWVDNGAIISLCWAHTQRPPRGSQQRRSVMIYDPFSRFGSFMESRLWPRAEIPPKNETRKRFLLRDTPRSSRLALLSLRVGKWVFFFGNYGKDENGKII